MSTKQAMEEIEDFLLFNKASLEKIRAGLKVVGEEEQQLLTLRHQLNKVKRIREEQIKKDDEIKKLQERIHLLEYEKSTALRQNSELHLIMTERIETLERHLMEKENTERIHSERLIVLEREVYDKASLEEEILVERKKTKEALAQVEKYRDEVKRLKSKSSTDNQLNEHFQSLFENLRAEINAKDAIISELKQRMDHKQQGFHQDVSGFKDRTGKLREELNILKDNLSRSERMNTNLSEELNRRTKENDGLQKLLQETEQVMSTFKATAQHEMEQLKADVQSVLSENETLHQEEALTRELCHAITKQVNLFTTLFREQQSDKFELRQVQEIFIELKRLKQSVTAPDPNEDLWAPLLTHFYKLIQLVCEKRNQSFDRIKSLEMKIASVDNVTTAFCEVEEKFSSVWEDAIVSDSIVQGLLEEITKSNVPWKPVSSESVEDVHREDTILSLPKATKKMSWNNKKISKFNSKRREKDYYELIEYIRQMIHIGKEYFAREELFTYLQQLQEELKTLQEKYQHDVNTLQRMSDEAYLAVKVNVVESEKQLADIKQDCERTWQLQTMSLRQDKQELLLSVQNLQEGLLSVLTFLGTILYLWEQQQLRYQHLTSCYQHAQHLVRGYERMTKDIRSISLQLENDLVNSSSAAAVILENNTDSSNLKQKISFRTAGMAVIAMVHWKKLSFSAKENHQVLSLASKTTDSSGHQMSHSMVQSLASSLTQLRQQAEALNNTATNSNTADHFDEQNNTSIVSSEEICQFSQKLMFTLGEWGLLNHQIVATNDASILLHQLLQRLQARTEQQQYQQQQQNNNYNNHKQANFAMDVAKYPSFSTLQQQQQQKQHVNKHTSTNSLLRLLAKPVSYTSPVDVSFFVSSPDHEVSDRKELFCHKEIATISAKTKECQARISYLTRKLSSANTASISSEQLLQQLQLQQDVVTQRITEELRRNFALEMDAAKKVAFAKGKEEERENQENMVATLEKEVSLLEARVTEMSEERNRLQLKLQKTHNILQSTASHALQDMRLSPDVDEDIDDNSIVNKSNNNINTSINANTSRDNHNNMKLNRSYVSTTSSTISSPPTAASTTGARLQTAHMLKRSNSFSEGVSVTSSQSTTARYQPLSLSASLAHTQRYTYLPPDANNTASRSKYLSTTTNKSNINTSFSSTVSSINSSTYAHHTTPCLEPPHVPAHIPYSLHETHGKDHNYNALEHQDPQQSPHHYHAHANHIYNAGKGHDVSAEMHHWTTSSLFQDSSFLSDPTMSAVLSEHQQPPPFLNQAISSGNKPTAADQSIASDVSLLNQSSVQSDSDNWLLRLRSEHYSSVPSQRGLSATYPQRPTTTSAGTSSMNATLMTESPVSKRSALDTSGETLLGYTPEVPNLAQRVAVSRRGLVETHRRSQTQSDRELQEIFQDIGRLTAKLETRLHETAVSSPSVEMLRDNNAKPRASSVGSRASTASRYHYNSHK